MKRVYLLLRNNQQSGPFTIGELLQQHITASDMVWIEGESSSWTPVSELELAPHREPSSFYSQNDIQRNAEELRQRGIYSRHQPKVYVEKPGDPVPSLAYADDDAIVLVDHRREKKNMLAEVGLTLLVVGLFAGGIWGSQTLFAGKKDVAAPVTTQMVTSDQNAAKPQPSLSYPDSLVSTGSGVGTDSTSRSQEAAKLSLTQKPVIKKAVDSQAVGNVKPVEALEPANTPEIEVVKPDATAVKEDLSNKKEEKAAEPKEKKEEPKAEEPEKKKGFLKGLFKKKKKDEDDKG